MRRRSMLFTPGHQPEMIRKAPRSGADALIFDLEDAVPPRRREQARETIVDVLSSRKFRPSGELCVRINPGETGMTDLDALHRADRDPDAIMLPKVTGQDDVEVMDETIRERFGVRLPLLVLLETAAGIERAPAIASVEATEALIFGAEDLSADIGATACEELAELSYARQRVVIAAAMGGVDPIDTPFTDIEDTDGLRRSARTAYRLGYVGKLAIHPDQVGPIAESFTPTEAEIEWAWRVLDAGEADPDGVYEVDGEMVDAPIRKRATRIIRQSGGDPGDV